MATNNNVHVAVFIYQGVLAGLEVFTDAEPAERRADEWRSLAGELDSVTVEEKEVQGK